jgi:hypothetical protein
MAQKYTYSQKIAVSSLIITPRCYAAFALDFPASGEDFLLLPGVDFLRAALRLLAVLGAVSVAAFVGAGLVLPAFIFARVLAASR